MSYTFVARYHRRVHLTYGKGNVLEFTARPYGEDKGYLRARSGRLFSKLLFRSVPRIGVFTQQLFADGLIEAVGAAVERLDDSHSLKHSAFDLSYFPQVQAVVDADVLARPSRSDSELAHRRYLQAVDAVALFSANLPLIARRPVGSSYDVWSATPRFSVMPGGVWVGADAHLETTNPYAYK